MCSVDFIMTPRVIPNSVLLSPPAACPAVLANV